MIDITISAEHLQAYMLIFSRMAGLILLNPFLTRRNVPSQVRAGLVLGMTLLMLPSVNAAAIPQLDGLVLIVEMIKELFVGFCCTSVFQIFYYLLFFAGDLMDMQFGMSMARVFDPGTNIQMSVTGNLLSILFMLYLFATDCHLLMIELFFHSFETIPVGQAAGIYDIPGFFLTMFAQAFSLLIRVTLPFLAAEFTVEMGMGMLMKLIPQIHVFVINIQIKMLLGLAMLFLYAIPIADFMNRYQTAMFQSVEKVFAIFV